MDEVTYDVPISEVAELLDRSDRQVRRYVKDKRLKASPVRVDGHVKLMFNREEVLAFGKRAGQGVDFGESEREIVIDAQLIGDGGDSAVREPADTVIDSPGVEESGAVKYVIDALREQITHLREENKELHYQLEQRSGQVGFLQGKVEALQEEVKMLMPAAPAQEEIIERKPWYRRLFGRS